MCVLLQELFGVFELIKMGVDEIFCGFGVGWCLFDVCIIEFYCCNGCMLFLEFNSCFMIVLCMYEKVGFVMQLSICLGLYYEWVDVYMVYYWGE